VISAWVGKACSKKFASNSAKSQSLHTFMQSVRDSSTLEERSVSMVSTENLVARYIPQKHARMPRGRKMHCQHRNLFGDDETVPVLHSASTDNCTIPG
jgi:hypothetical protein